MTDAMMAQTQSFDRRKNGPPTPNDDLDIAFGVLVGAMVAFVDMAYVDDGQTVRLMVGESEKRNTYVRIGDLLTGDDRLDRIRVAERLIGIALPLVTAEMAARELDSPRRRMVVVDADGRS